MKVVCVLDSWGKSTPNVDRQSVSATANLGAIDSPRRAALTVIEKVCKRYLKNQLFSDLKFKRVIE